MPDANLLFSRTFDGAGYPSFDVVWPGFTFDPSAAFDDPVVDGHGHGMANRFVRVDWLAKATGYPGRESYKADLWGKWKNPGFSAGRAIGLILRFRDWSNYLSVRMTSQSTANPTLEIVRVLGGVEKVLASYTGAGVNAAKMQVGMKWRGRVAEQSDGTSIVQAFTDPLGASGDGDLRLTWEGDLGPLRGLYGLGVELKGAMGTEVLVDDLEVYDFADEWTETASPPAPGSGWSMLLRDRLLHVDEWADEDHPIEVVEAVQGFGPGGNTCTVKVKGKFQLGPITPNERCVIYHDGDVRFRGHLTRAKLAGQPSQETQTFMGRDALWQARNVRVKEVNGAPQRLYNVSDPEADGYLPDRQDMTIGQIIQDLFDTYTDGDEGLRFFGACAPDATPYLAADIASMDAVIPDVAVGGSFLSAVMSLLQWQYAHQVFVDPDTQIWRFIDVTLLTGETVTLTTDHVTLMADPDAERSFTAVEWCGSLPEDQGTTTIEMGYADRAWTQGQEEGGASSRNKRHLGSRSGSIVIASTTPFPAPDGVPATSLVYIDVPASLGFETDEWRGAICTVAGDAYPRFVVANSSTRLYLGAPLWGGGSPPSPGSSFTVSLVDERAIPILSAQGVGRVFFVPPAQINGCGTGGFKFGGLKNRGRCTRVLAAEVGEDGTVHFHDRRFEVHRLNSQISSGMTESAQDAFGGAEVCPTYLALAEAPKPEIGLVNRLPQPGGSPPSSPCESQDVPQIDLRVSFAEAENEVPCFRVPATVGHYTGNAFSRDSSQWDGGEPNKAAGDFGVRRVMPIDHPAFRNSTTQQAGLTKAAEALLAVLSEENWRVTLTIASNWKAQGIIRPRSTTSTWAGLTRQVYIASGKRTTGFEAAVGLQLPVFQVRWQIRANKTVLSAGTANGWLAPNAKAITDRFTKHDALKQTAALMKQLEEFRSCWLAKREGLGMESRNIPGCDVQVINRNTKTVKNVQLDDENKEEWINHQGLGALATNLLVEGQDEGGERGHVPQPGMDEDDHQFPVAGDQVLRSHTNHRVPFAGPPAGGINADKGRYGGLPGAHDPQGLKPPQEIIRRGPVSIRKKADAGGAAGAGTGLEFATIGPDGQPTSGWSDYTSAADLRAAGVDPWDLVNSRSLLFDVGQRLQHLEREVTRTALRDDGLPAFPGEVTTEYPDGAPASLASYARVDALRSSLFHLLPETWDDPGGMVFRGPMIVDEDSGQLVAGYSTKLWRVAAPMNVLLQVEDLGMGSGTNGGRYGTKVESDGTVEYIANARSIAIHKQASDAEDVSSNFGGAPGAAEPYIGPDPSHPWGMAGSRYETDPSGPSALAWVFNLPKRTYGAVGFQVGFREHPLNPLGAGNTWDYSIQSIWSQSPWGAPSAVGSGSVTGNAGGDEQGQFVGPGGAVPPGLRTPYGPDFTAAVVSPGSGSAATNAMLVDGAHVEVVVVEGGFMLLTSEAMGVADTAVLGDAFAVESLSVADALALEIQKMHAEAVLVTEQYDVELNPDVDEQESVTVGVVLTLSIIEEAEAVAVADSIATELNP